MAGGSSSSEKWSRPASDSHKPATLRTSAITLLGLVLAQKNFAMDQSCALSSRPTSNGFWTNAGIPIVSFPGLPGNRRMVFHGSDPHHWSYRQRRPPGSRSIAGARACESVRLLVILTRLVCRHTLKWCAEISLSLRPWMKAWMASMRCSWCGPPRRPPSLPLWRGSRRTQAHRVPLVSSQDGTPLLPKPQPNPVSALHAQIERLIEASGCQWTFLRPGIFAANARAWWAPQIRAGSDVVRWPYVASCLLLRSTSVTSPPSRSAPCVRMDTLERNMCLTGSQSLSQFEQISIIGSVIGRSLRMEEISPEDARR